MPLPQTPLPEPLLALAFAAISVAFATRIPRRRDALWRWISLAGGMALLAVCWLSPLQSLSVHYLLSAHLLQVTLVMGVIPPLLLLSIPPDAPAPGSPWLRWLASVAVNPTVAIIAVNTVFFVSHGTGIFDRAQKTPLLFDGLELLLLAASIALWCPIVGPWGRAALSPVGRLFYILLAAIPQTFAGLMLAVTSRVLYPAYGQAPRVLGLSVITDQQLAGALLAVAGKLALLVAFAVILVRLLDGQENQDDEGGGGSRDLPTPLPPGRPVWTRQRVPRRVATPPSVARGRQRVPTRSRPRPPVPSGR